jgi:hypothetical protein
MKVQLVPVFIFKHEVNLQTQYEITEGKVPICQLLLTLLLLARTRQMVY